MSEDQNPRIPSIPEVDQYGGDELPSYDDLAAQNGPNSRCLSIVTDISSDVQLILSSWLRFGRWRAWIEKRYGYAVALHD